MEDRTRDIIDYSAIVAGFVGMIVALVGEILGWWNNVGLLIGALSLMASAAGAFDVVGRTVLRTVTPLSSMIVGVGEQVHGVGGEVDGLGEKVDGVGVKVDAPGVKVDGLGLKMDTLGVKQDESNRHLVRIADVLEERLPPPQ